MKRVLAFTQTSPCFYVPEVQVFIKKTAGKGEIARNEEFVLFPQCYLPFWRTFAIFMKFKIVVCRLFQFGKVQNLSFRKGLIRFRKKIVRLEFYATSTVFQLFNGDSSQIHVFWTTFNQYFTRPLSWHWWVSRSAITIILSAKAKSFKDFGLSRPGIEPTTSRPRSGRFNH